MKQLPPGILNYEISYTAVSGLQAGYMQLLTKEELDRKILWLKEQQVVGLKVYNGSTKIYPKSKIKKL